MSTTPQFDSPDNDVLHLTFEASTYKEFFTPTFCDGGIPTTCAGMAPNWLVSIPSFPASFPPSLHAAASPRPARFLPIESGCYWFSLLALEMLPFADSSRQNSVHQRPPFFADPRVFCHVIARNLFYLQADCCSVSTPSVAFSSARWVSSRECFVRESALLLLLLSSSPQRPSTCLSPLLIFAHSRTDSIDKSISI